MKKCNWIPLPAGFILGMVKRMMEEAPGSRPITMKGLIDAKNRYILIAQRLN